MEITMEPETNLSKTNSNITICNIEKASKYNQIIVTNEILALVVMNWVALDEFDCYAKIDKEALSTIFTPEIQEYQLKKFLTSNVKKTTNIKNFNPLTSEEDYKNFIYQRMIELDLQVEYYNEIIDFIKRTKQIETVTSFDLLELNLAIKCLLAYVTVHKKIELNTKDIKPFVSKIYN